MILSPSRVAAARRVPDSRIPHAPGTSDAREKRPSPRGRPRLSPRMERYGCEHHRLRRTKPLTTVCFSSLAEHRCEPALSHHFACWLHLSSDSFQEHPKLFVITPLPLSPSGVIAAEPRQLFARGAPLREEILEGTLHDSAHRRLRHKRTVTMRAMKHHASMKMAIRHVELFRAVLAD